MKRRLLVNNPWRTKSTLVKYEDPWIQVEVNNVVEPNGKDGIYSVVRMKGGIGVVATDDTDRICLVGQFRYAPGVYSWEIPKGAFATFGGLESPMEKVCCELVEETGFRARHWIELGIVHTLLGSSDDKVVLFHASQLDAGQASPEPTELICTKIVGLDEFLRMQEKAEITDATSIAAVFMAIKKGLLKW